MHSRRKIKTMTPKEKAVELVDSFRIILIQSDTDAGEEIICTTIAKQCALIAVDEILNNFGLVSESYIFYTNSDTRSFYEEVKEEIEKL